MGNPVGTFTGRIQAIHAPDQIDGDGHDYFTLGAIDVVPEAPEQPWVLSIDLSNPRASEMCLTAVEAIVRKAFVAFELEPERKGRIAEIRLDQSRKRSE